MAAGQADETLLAQLRDRVAQRVTDWRPGALVRGVSPLTGGTSSLTFLVDLDGVDAGETPVVLKVAPPGLAPLRNRDVLRQARLQKAVQRAGRPLAPDVLFSDPGDPPQVPPFMAMNLVPGDCVEPVLTDAAQRPGPDQVRARFFDAVQVLAQLHEIKPAAVGLGGEPVVGLADEVDRWTRAFVTLPGDMAGDYQRAAKALRASIPKALPPAVNHGDFRLGNTLCEGEPDQRGDRLGDLVGRRPAHRPGLADLLHRRRRAPRRRPRHGRGHPRRAARSSAPTRTRSAGRYPNSAGSTRSPGTRRPASPACSSSGR